MEYTELFPSGPSVSKICLGTMTWGEQNTEAQAHEQLDYALDQGVNFIDAAELYPIPRRAATQGLTEQYIGSWIATRRQRDRYVLASKVTGPGNMPWIRKPLRYDPVSLRQALEGSLRRLRADYVDLYQLLWPERKTNRFGIRGYEYDPTESWKDNFSEVLHTMAAFIAEGKIRYFGVSNETPWGLMRWLHVAERENLPRCVSIQNAYSLLNRTFEIGHSEIALRERCGLLAYSPLAFGLLSGKYQRGEDTPADRMNRYRELDRYGAANTRRAADRYVAIAEKHGLRPAHLALAFVSSRPFVISNIIGATNMDQLRENIDSIRVTLSPEALRDIEDVHRDIPDPAP
jgi:aryl-alcohol dehydrogenase-like predicted oxidoreductase